MDFSHMDGIEHPVTCLSQVLTYVCTMVTVVCLCALQSKPSLIFRTCVESPALLERWSLSSQVEHHRHSVPNELNRFRSTPRFVLGAPSSSTSNNNSDLDLIKGCIASSSRMGNYRLGSPWDAAQRTTVLRGQRFGVR